MRNIVPLNNLYFKTVNRQTTVEGITTHGLPYDVGPARLCKAKPSRARRLF